MKDDRFIKKVLLVIALLLALNIVMPILYNLETSFAATVIEYKVFDVREGEVPDDPEGFEKFLNEQGREGWEYFGVTVGVPMIVLKRIH